MASQGAVWIGEQRRAEKLIRSAPGNEISSCESATVTLNFVPLVMIRVIYSRFNERAAAERPSRPAW
jgi:hypothetical protein